MPELPEVQTVVNGLQQHLPQRQIKHIDVLRGDPVQPIDPQEFIGQLCGRTFKKIARRGKYLVFHLQPRLFLVGHLRMTGKFILATNAAPITPHQRVRFYLDDDRVLIFDDVRCFGTLRLYTQLAQCESLNLLGPEPFSSSLTAKNLLEKLQSSRSMKSLLLDQGILAGLGNIYVNEILFQAGVHPERSGHSMKPEECTRILRCMRRILKQAIQLNGTSISDFRRVDDKTGTFQNFLKVYGKGDQPCLSCQTPIKRIVQNQRSTFYCAQCQN